MRRNSMGRMAGDAAEPQVPFTGKDHAVSVDIWASIKASLRSACETERKQRCQRSAGFEQRRTHRVREYSRWSFFRFLVGHPANRNSGVWIFPANRYKIGSIASHKSRRTRTPAKPRTHLTDVLRKMETGEQNLDSRMAQPALCPPLASLISELHPAFSPPKLSWRR